MKKLQILILSVFLFQLVGAQGTAQANKPSKRSAQSKLVTAEERELRAFYDAYGEDLRLARRESIADRYDRRGYFRVGNGKKALVPFSDLRTRYLTVWNPPLSFQWKDLSFEILSRSAANVIGLFDWQAASGERLTASYTALLIKVSGKWVIRVEDESVPQVSSGQPAARADQKKVTPSDSTDKLKTEQGESGAMKVLALRLRPGQDLRLEIEKFAKAKGIKAGFIITTVGSLTKASLRLADQSNSSSFDGKFEIVSLVGTIAPDGVHLHLSISDSSGKTIGGHLVEGCQIYTTAEILIGEAEDLLFSRETDSVSGYKELKVRARRIRVKKLN